MEYESLSLASPGSHRGHVLPPPVAAHPQYVPETPPAPYNDVVVCSQCGYLFSLHTVSMLNVSDVDPVEDLNFDWLNDLAFSVCCQVIVTNTSSVMSL
ncbi:hypothetical protein ZOSMA_4G01450 [Zostera marina]|uniref:Uncharacterized protein n=1 Tax=Zostera marina TaxID=29655 RepID=A0A0K9NYH2_ZOSMR|nr:hypothetical protein ZOSMA_4G01450 [Zostera marina]